MKRFGLIGYPLGHSFSKGYFAEKFNKENISGCEYESYPIENIEMFPGLVKSIEGLGGLNVTLPYKEHVIGYLDEIDVSAKEIGAVNTIKVIRENDSIKLKGFNTDVYGFEKPLLDAIKGKCNLKGLILGTGGASKAVAWVLKKNNIDFSFVSRSPDAPGQIAYSDIDDVVLSEHKIIINTSPIGMYPNIEAAPDINYGAISQDHILYDLVYNPEETLFLKRGKEKKATTITGLPMLYLQAEKAWEIWNS